MSRSTLLAALTVVCLLLTAAWWFLRPTGITLHFKQAPLSKVLPVIEKKTRIKILTDANPATPVTMMVYQASAPVVWEALAGALDARATIRIALAPDHPTLNTYLDTLRAGQRPEGWSHYRYPLPGGFLTSSDSQDPRTLPLALPDDWPATTLQENLQLLAQCSEASWVAPDSWNPAVQFLPQPHTTAPRAATALARAIGGTHLLFLHLSTVRGRGEPRPEASARRDDSAGPGVPRGPWASPEIMQRRMEVRLAALPPAERQAARQGWERSRDLFLQMRDLPPEQRREKIQELFNDPAIQERMEERQATRDERRSPEKRRERYRDYIERRSQNHPAP